MINKIDLRIGNYVNSKLLGSNHKITGLLPNVFYTDLQSSYSEYEDWQPIQLTEEILLKCGYSESDLENGKILVVGESFDNVIGYTIRSLSSSIVVKTVHQLQNLFYALNNKELEIVW